MRELEEVEKKEGESGKTRTGGHQRVSSGNRKLGEGVGEQKAK